jgi:hypothetical protein
MTSEHFVIEGADSRGQVVEMGPRDKAKVAVGLAAAEHDPDFSIWAKDLTFGPVNFTPKGDLLNKLYVHNDYVAEGTGLFTFKRRTDASQTLLEPKRRAFKVKFSDQLNKYGAPGIKIDSFTLEPSA